MGLDLFRGIPKGVPRAIMGLAVWAGFRRAPVVPAICAASSELSTMKCLSLLFCSLPKKMV